MTTSKESMPEPGAHTASSRIGDFAKDRHGAGVRHGAARWERSHGSGTRR
jgi:hypothetical protein